MKNPFKAVKEWFNRPYTINTDTFQAQDANKAINDARVFVQESVQIGTIKKA